MKLFELCGNDREVRFSPYVWRVKLFLQHKGLDYETVPLHFVEKEQLGNVTPQTFPALQDGDRIISDSFEIAKYLDQTYPQNMIFSTQTELAQASSLLAMVDRIIAGGLFSMVALDVWKQLDEQSKEYFRKTREARVGQTLEDFVADREDRLTSFRQDLAPFRKPLESFSYLSGDEPGWLDYTVMGTFMWARTISDFAFLEENDPLYQWEKRMSELWDGAFVERKRAV